MTPLAGFHVPAGVGARPVRVVITNPTGFREVFGIPAPASLDFHQNAVIFYSAGTEPTGGYVASVLSAKIDARQELEITTRLSSPGAACDEPQHSTIPLTVVTFRRPVTLPSRVHFDESNVVQTCGGALAGQDCDDSNDCAQGLSCVGQAEQATGQVVGICRNEGVTTQPPPTCHADSECSHGETCTGLTRLADPGEQAFCLPAWASGTFTSTTEAPLESRGQRTVTQSIFVHGLGLDVADARLHVELNESNPDHLKITLTNPSGVSSTVWDHHAERWTGDFVVKGYSDEDAANGSWVLEIDDSSPVDPASLLGWSLELRTWLD